MKRYFALVSHGWCKAETAEDAFKGAKDKGKFDGAYFLFSYESDSVELNDGVMVNPVNGEIVIDGDRVKNWQEVDRGEPADSPVRLQ